MKFKKYFFFMGKGAALILAFILIGVGAATFIPSLVNQGVLNSVQSSVESNKLAFLLLRFSVVCVICFVLMPIKAERVVRDERGDDYSQSEVDGLFKPARDRILFVYIIFELILLLRLFW